MYCSNLRIHHIAEIYSTFFALAHLLLCRSQSPDHHAIDTDPSVVPPQFDTPLSPLAPIRADLVPAQAP